MMPGNLRLSEPTQFPTVSQGAPGKSSMILSRRRRSSLCRRACRGRLAAHAAAHGVGHGAAEAAPRRTTKERRYWRWQWDTVDREGFNQQMPEHEGDRSKSHVWNFCSMWTLRFLWYIGSVEWLDPHPLEQWKRLRDLEEQSRNSEFYAGLPKFQPEP